MEDSWLLSTPMLLNANTPTLEMKKTKTQRELSITIDEMINILEHFRKKLEQFRQNLQSGSLLFDDNSR